MDHESLAFGLATTGGVATTTGVGGLTLGGGIGLLNQKYGLTCDNLLAADVVTADGQFLTATATKNADLFWALRGGGGNFGIVTSFEYQLHEVGRCWEANWHGRYLWRKKSFASTGIFPGTPRTNFDWTP